MCDVITIHGREQSLVDEALADGGLPPAVGVLSYCVFRASKDAPSLSDGRGWTYHHHVDMATWKGRLYVGWNSCERDEDVWPSRELFSTSVDGRTWEPPQEMFPQGLSICLRVYFFLAPNGRMLVIAGLRAGIEKTNEDTKGALIVREIRSDHTWGEIYTLQPPTGPVQHPSMYTNSPDGGFVAACQTLLADTVFLEQQDRGRLLGDRRMIWHDSANWPGGKVPGDNEKWVAGKAYTFFTRPDGAIVGVSKMGWTTISFDDGRTWQQPAVPPTLVTGKAKVFAHRTPDGRYALVYNPSRRNRFPLVLVTGDDGVNFGDMRLIHGELPIQRYAGADRSIGPQYTRGVSKWANDGSRADNALWLVYSMSKEDIWVSRVPTPVRTGETCVSIEGFDDWNIYQPKWASAEISDSRLRLESRDPYDHAIATRVLPAGGSLEIRFDVTVERPGLLEIDLCSEFGATRPVRLAICDAAAGESVSMSLKPNLTAGHCQVTINDRPARILPFAEPAERIHRIVFRTGEYRGIGGKKPVEAGMDKPGDRGAFVITAFQAG